MVTIQKRIKNEDNKAQVTFTMPAIEGCDCLYLVGKFYEWNESVYPMQRAEDGTWTLTLELESDREYQYCFRTCDGMWLNNPSTPHALNSYGFESSIISKFTTVILT